MTDFTSDFWSWFVIVPVLAGIAGLFWLNIWMSGPTKKSKKSPETMGHVWDGDLEELNNPLPRWWLNLFYLTLVFGLVYLLLFPGLGRMTGILGWTQTDQYQKEIDAANQRYNPLFDQYRTTDLTVLAQDPAALKTGERLYANYCATCHGSDARGASGFPNLRDSDWLYGGTPAAIEASILNGRSGVMPPWGAVLGAQGAEQMARYILSLSGHDVDATLAAANKEKFQQMCAACHGLEGIGNSMLGAPNLTDDVWLYGGSQLAVKESIEKGRLGRMPAHAEFLGESKVHLLAAYVYSLSQDKAAATEKQPRVP